jgi:Fic family protein
LRGRQTSERAGRFIRQAAEGYAAFIPARLPPDPPIAIDGTLRTLLSEANLALGRLDGVIGILPNPDLFVAMYVRQEAVLSSQIEGTQASLADLLEYETGEDDETTGDVAEVVNYIGAMQYGLSRLETLPLSLRLTREIHERLLRDVRGQDRNRGEFRRTQNWIGPAGCTLKDAAFVPPPPQKMRDALADLELFLHDESLPSLVHAAIAHAQFETIHPFLDGNGRVGRLLITFLLCHRRVLSQPLLYLSHYFKSHRQEYYDRLQAVRMDGRWEEWLGFFLQGVKEVATEANETARKILALREAHRTVLGAEGKASGNLLRALDVLFEHPVVTVRSMEKWLGVTFATANKIVNRLEELGLLTEITGYQRNRRFKYAPYLDLFEASEAASTWPEGETLTTEQRSDQK